MNAREIILQTLAVHPGGMTCLQLATELALPYRLVGLTLRDLRKDQFADHAGHARLWGTWANTKRLRAKLAREATRGVNQRQRAKRKKQAAAKMYDKPDFNPYNVRDLPIQQHRVTTWTPVRVPPGPTSVFNLGAQHA